MHAGAPNVGEPEVVTVAPLFAAESAAELAWVMLIVPAVSVSKMTALAPAVSVLAGAFIHSVGVPLSVFTASSPTCEPEDFARPNS